MGNPYKTDFKTLKIKDTITTSEKCDMLTSYKAVGIFENLFIPIDPCYEQAAGMCIGYYISHSANKTVSPFFNEMLEYEIANGAYTPEADVLKRCNRIMGVHVIRPKFIDKWTRVYNALISEQYNALDDYSETEVKTGTDTDTTTYNLSDKKSGNNTDTITHDIKTEDTGKASSSSTGAGSTDSAKGSYGFNSSAASGDSTTQQITNESAESEANSKSTQSKTGTESKQIGIDETYDKTGTETKEYGVNETIARNGRHTSGADLINKELNLRNKQIFFDIVYKDIDSVATIPLY